MGSDIIYFARSRRRKFDGLGGEVPAIVTIHATLFQAVAHHAALFFRLLRLLHRSCP